MGYLDALKAFDRLIGHKYYFKNMYDESDIVKRFNTLSNDDKQELTKLLLDKEMINERFFYEKVIPRIAKEVGCNINCSYQEILVRVYEKLLSFNNEETMEVYSPTIVKHHLEGVQFPEEFRVFEILLKL